MVSHFLQQRPPQPEHCDIENCFFHSNPTHESVADGQGDMKPPYDFLTCIPSFTPTYLIQYTSIFLTYKKFVNLQANSIASDTPPKRYASCANIPQDFVTTESGWGVSEEKLAHYCCA